MPRKFRTFAAGLGFALGLSFTAAAASVQVADGLSVDTLPQVSGTFQFAHGFGLIYGPMPVARQLGIVEKMFPNAKIEWQNIFTTAQQRDAMLAGRLHFGSCTPGPYLQSWDKGVDWKWLQTTSGFDGYLMVRKDGPNSVLEFIGTQKKMSPGPNTAQYFTVQEILRQSGKDVKALDRNWANLPHPDAMQALIAGQLDGHFATSDFALRLEEQGMKKIASIKQAYGSLYAVGACALTKTVQEHPEVARGYAMALRKVVEWMKANPEKAAEMMSKSTGNKVSTADFVKYLKSATYDSYAQDADLKTHAAAMHAFGAIKRVPKGPADFYAFPDEAGAKW
ncbi:MAG: ABC transporter substrate-binding protein [Gemmatimonadaceae bacterium]|nr:ABC transporter substrate-binding protein [Gemmatimonadaceae bacterium]